MIKLDTYIQGYQWFEIAPKLQPHKDVRVEGWGVTEPDGEHPLPQMLQELDTKLLPASGCPAAMAQRDPIVWVVWVGVYDDFATGEPCSDAESSDIVGS